MVRQRLEPLALQQNGTPAKWHSLDLISVPTRVPTQLGHVTLCGGSTSMHIHVYVHLCTCTCTQELLTPSRYMHMYMYMYIYTCTCVQGSLTFALMNSVCDHPCQKQAKLVNNIHVHVYNIHVHVYSNHACT